MNNTTGNGLTFRWGLGVAGVVIMLLLSFSGFLLRGEQVDAKRTLDDHELRIRICEQTDARRDEQLKAIQASLARMERHLGTLPDSVRQNVGQR